MKSTNSHAVAVVILQCLSFGSACIEPAAPTRAADHGDGVASDDSREAVDWIPMDLYLDRFIYLRGRVNGVETDVVLDSGAAMTVIDAALAKRLGLTESSAVTAQGIGGTQSATFLAGVAIEIGPVTLRVPRAVGIDMSGVETLLGRAMPVIVGLDVMRDLVVDLDYPNARVAFPAASEYAYSGPGRGVELFDAHGGLWAIEARIEDRPAARFTLDTGSSDTVAVFEAFTAEHALLAGRSPVSTRRSGGVGGSILSSVATLRSFTLAGFELAHVPATFPQTSAGLFDTDAVAGNLGAGILSRFRVILDGPRSRAHFEPSAGWNERAFRKDRLGLSCAYTSAGVVVDFVAPGSPAAASGWSAGDTIAAIDGEPLSAVSWRMSLSRFANAPAGARVVLTDREGRERKLVTADYY